MPLADWTETERERMLAQAAARDAAEIAPPAKPAPSGWWIVPAVIGGLAAWLVLILFAVMWLLDWLGDGLGMMFKGVM